MSQPLRGTKNVASRVVWSWRSSVPVSLHFQKLSPALQVWCFFFFFFWKGESRPEIPCHLVGSAIRPSQNTAGKPRNDKIKSRGSRWKASEKVGGVLVVARPKASNVSGWSTSAGRLAVWVAWGSALDGGVQWSVGCGRRPLQRCSLQVSVVGLGPVSGSTHSLLRFFPASSLLGSSLRWAAVGQAGLMQVGVGSGM